MQNVVKLIKDLSFTSLPRLDTADNLGEGTALDDSASREIEPKVPLTSPHGSPSSASGQLFAPHYAGNIQHIREVGGEGVHGEPTWLTAL